jgi:ribonuclease HI
MSGCVEPPSEHAMDVSVFVHAASSVSVGPGGYGIVILRPDGQFQLSGHVSNTQRRTLELQSVVEALNAVAEPAKVRLSCNSSYIARASRQGWIESWQRAEF